MQYFFFFNLVLEDSISKYLNFLQNEILLFFKIKYYHDVSESNQTNTAKEVILVETNVLDTGNINRQK